MTEQTINWAAVAATSIPAICLLLRYYLGYRERQTLRAMGERVPVPPDSPAGPAAMVLVVILGLAMSDFAGVRRAAVQGLDFQPDTRTRGLYGSR